MHKKLKNIANMPLEFCMIQGADVKPFLSSCIRCKLDQNYCFGNVFVGFRYLSPIDFEDKESLFIVALHSGCVVGVLKIKRYAVHNHRFVEEKEKIKNYIAIRYIDVHIDYKGKGVGTELINHMCSYLKALNTTDIVKVSPMTEEGAKFDVLGKVKAKLPTYKVRVVRR